MQLLLPVSYYGHVVPLQATVQYLLWLPRSLFRGLCKNLNKVTLLARLRSRFYKTEG